MEELRTAKKEMKSADEKRERKGHDDSGVTKERQLTSVNTEWLIDRYLVRWWYEDSYPREDAPRPDDLDEDLAKIPGYDFIYRNLKTGKIVLKRDSNPAPSRKRMRGFDFRTIKDKVTFAIERQMEELRKAEPNNKALFAQLQRELHHIKDLRE